MKKEPNEVARTKIISGIHEFFADQLEDTHYLGDWAIVLHVGDIVDSNYVNYATIFPSTNMPVHTAIGLFQVGIDVASGDGWDRKDEEEEP